MQVSPADQLAALPAPERVAIIKRIEAKGGPEAVRSLSMSWRGFHARPDQILPVGDWVYWLILAGRGWGKTRTGAEAVREWAPHNEYVNLIGATTDDAKDIMIEGESGILACCPPDERPVYKKHERKLEWPSGCVSLVFTADEPDRLRGKQHSKLWGDELASWRYPESWDQAKFGLRLGSNPQAVITTTPRPTKIIRALVQDPLTVPTRGTTYDNRANLPESFVHEILKKYEGTRLGRQELYAEILDDMPGALWRRSVLDDQRLSVDVALPEIKRVVVAVDPAVSTNEDSDETGIIAAAVTTPDEHGISRGLVLDDASGVYTPDEWARQVRALVSRHSADAVVAEGNQGGNLVEHVIKGVLPNTKVKIVHASHGKVTRAEPASALYEQGRVSHVGRFNKLEDQMCVFTSDFDRKSQGFSPDRVDALVWALAELFPQIVKRKAIGKPVRYRAKARFM